MSIKYNFLSLNMKLSFLSLLNLFIFIVILMSCSTDELSKKDDELMKLKNKISEDSILLIKLDLSIQEINFTLDSVAYINKELATTKTFTKEEAVKQ